MKAILISAGKGTRLLPLTEELPKCILPLYDNITVIDHQFKSLQEAGINNIAVILGYKAEMVEKILEKYNSDFNIDIVYNPFFEESNNLISLWMAREHFNDDIITINGDDIFHSDVIKSLQNSKKDITLTASQKSEYDLDDMKIIHQEERLLQIGKDIEMEKANGESIGIIKYSKQGALTLKNKLDKMVRLEENKHKFYLKAIQEIVNDNIDVDIKFIKNDLWAEIDFHYDLQFVQKNYKRFKEASKRLS